MDLVLGSLAFFVGKRAPKSQADAKKPATPPLTRPHHSTSLLPKRTTSSALWFGAIRSDTHLKKRDLIETEKTPRDPSPPILEASKWLFLTTCWAPLRALWPPRPALPALRPLSP